MLRFSLVAVFFSIACLAQAQDATPLRVVPDAAPAISVVEQAFDDWTYRCQLGADGALAGCEVSQRVFVELDGGLAEVLKLAIAPADDQAGKVDDALIVRALGDVHLASDFGLQFGSRKPFKTRYRNCNTLGCWVVMPADRKLISGMKQAADGSARFRLLNGQVLKVVFSLAGFTRAYAAFASGDVPTANEVQQ